MWNLIQRSFEMGVRLLKKEEERTIGQSMPNLVNFFVLPKAYLALGHL